MKYFFLLFASFFISVTGYPKSIKPSQQKKYTVAVSFGSVCCGTSSSAFLSRFLKDFNTKNKVKVAADIAEGCGRECEFIVLILFPKNNLKKEKKFLLELEKSVTFTDTKNNKENTSAGRIFLLYDVKETDYDFCRLGVKKWIL